MDCPNILKGHLYGSTRVARCPMYHACLVTKKCQSYNPHVLQCSVCESRVRPPENLGGHLPEGEYLPDIQESIHTIEMELGVPMVHPDAEPQKMNSYEITDNYNKVRQSSEILAKYHSLTNSKVEEEIEEVLLHPERDADIISKFR